MASIENRSRFIVNVKNRKDLTQSFAYNREQHLKKYLLELQGLGYKPKLKRTNDNFAIRVRDFGHAEQCLYAKSAEEAIGIKQRIENERSSSLFVDYAKGRSVTFGDLLARYLREISPRHKCFQTEGYLINALLADAGLARVDIAIADIEINTNFEIGESTWQGPWWFPRGIGICRKSRPSARTHPT